MSPAMVARWASTRASVDLRLLDDRQLSASVDLTWRESERFLGLGPTPPPLAAR